MSNDGFCLFYIFGAFDMWQALVGAKIDPKTIANVLKEKLINMNYIKKKFNFHQGLGGAILWGLKVGEDKLDLI